MQTVNAKELFGFLPHQSLEVYTGTIHAKKCKKVVLNFLIPCFELRIFSGEYERMEYYQNQLGKYCRVCGKVVKG